MAVEVAAVLSLYLKPLQEIGRLTFNEKQSYLFTKL